MTRPTEDLPDDFAIALGRITYLGGRDEMLLDRLLAPVGGQPPRRGLSGARLVKDLLELATEGDNNLEEIIEGYEQQHEWRNHLVHGAHHYANDILWTWREPVAAKGNAGFSFQFTLESLERLAASWQNLAHAVHAELHRRSPSVDDE